MTLIPLSEGARIFWARPKPGGGSRRERRRRDKGVKKAEAHDILEGANVGARVTASAAADSAVNHAAQLKVRRKAAWVKPQSTRRLFRLGFQPTPCI